MPDASPESAPRDPEPPQAGTPPADSAASPSRRSFLSKATGIAMAGGLAASYGTFGTIAARYLYPSGKAKTNWQFVVAAGEVKKGAALLYRVPGGEQVTIARREETGAVEDFVALSSTCPHLGCKVHWQSTEQRFFCPCHNGAFDASGKATAGPPADAGQSLPRYPLKVEDGLLFIEVPSDPLQVG